MRFPRPMLQKIHVEAMVWIWSSKLYRYPGNNRIDIRVHHNSQSGKTLEHRAHTRVTHDEATHDHGVLRRRAPIAGLPAGSTHLRKYSGKEPS